MQIVMMIATLPRTIETTMMTTVEEEMEDGAMEITMVVEVVEITTTEAVAMIAIKVITMAINSQEKHKNWAMQCLEPIQRINNQISHNQLSRFNQRRHPRV